MRKICEMKINYKIISSLKPLKPQKYKIQLIPQSN